MLIRKQVLGKLAATTCACLLAGTALADFPLVRDGRATPIVIPAEAEASTELAARELADYVEKITDIRPQILTNDCGRSPRVEIGTLNTMAGLPKALVRRFDASSSWESYVVSCGKDVLRIVGRDEVAELYGTYQFVEKHLGVRWFKEWTKEDPGEYVPRRTTIGIPAGSIFRAPDLSERSLSQTGALCSHVPHHGIEWTVRIGLQANPWGGVNFMSERRPNPKWGEHMRDMYATFKPRASLRRVLLGGGHMMLADPIKGGDYFASHPEYFAEVDGKRVNGQRYCLSNPDVQRLVAEDVIRRLDKTGGKGGYLFGLQDGERGVCECASCRALDDEAAKAGPLNRNISTRLHGVAAKIAAQVYAKYPQANLYDWAYSLYRTPPVGVKLDPRTGVELCIHGRCCGHALDDPHCARNPAMLKWVKDWLKVASWGKTYEYANCSHNYYCPLETVYPHDLKYYHRLGLRGWHEEMGYADSVHYPFLPKGQFDERKEKSLTNWQWFYVAAKVSWDTSLDPEAVLADAEEKYYGPAYPAMKEYHRLRRKSWKNAPVCWGYGDYPMVDERTRIVLDEPGLKDRLLALLDEAEKLVEGQRSKVKGQTKEAKDRCLTSDLGPLTFYQFRVGKDREWLHRYWIEPNEKARKSRNRALRAPFAAGAIVADGDDSDASWGLAQWVEEGAPDRVNVAAVSDDANLYFLFRYLGTKDEMRHDRLGVVLYPPDADNTGKSYEFTADLAQCAKGSDTGYTAELKVPTDGIRKLVRGEIWRVKFFRNPDGNEPDVRYPLEIGTPKLQNGSFENLDDKGKPKSWDLPAKFRLVDLPGHQHALKLGSAMQGLSWKTSFATKPYARKVRISFRAWGEGRVDVSLIRYKDTPNPKAKYGYERKIMQPAVGGGRHDVTAEPRYYTATCEIPAGEWVALHLLSGWVKGVKSDITVDDVSMTEE